MKLENVNIESDRRCSAEALEEILKNAQIEVECEGRLNARMGLGRMIYIRPTDDAEIKYVQAADARVRITHGADSVTDNVFLERADRHECDPQYKVLREGKDSIPCQRGHIRVRNLPFKVASYGKRHARLLNGNVIQVYTDKGCDIHYVELHTPMRIILGQENHGVMLEHNHLIYNISHSHVERD
jgi:hypothetical protein